jgi:hypothetical protein
VFDIDLTAALAALVTFADAPVLAAQDLH